MLYLSFKIYYLILLHSVELAAEMTGFRLNLTTTFSEIKSPVPRRASTSILTLASFGREVSFTNRYLQVVVHEVKVVSNLPILFLFQLLELSFLGPAAGWPSAFLLSLGTPSRMPGMQCREPVSFTSLVYAAEPMDGLCV